MGIGKGTSCLLADGAYVVQAVVFFTARLLQLAVVRCYRQLGSTSSSCPKCCRAVTGIRRCEHITPVLRQLYWLSVRQRIEFKLAVLVYKSLNASSPRYLMDDCQLITTTGRGRLRSSNVATCDVSRTRTSLSDRSCRWSTSVEQFTSSSAGFWTNTSWVSPISENASVWLKAAAPSDWFLVFSALYI